MADYDLIPHSFDGTQINDGTNFSAAFSPGLSWGLPSVQAVMVPRHSAWPVTSGLERNDGRVMTLIVRIKGADKRALRDELLRLFDPERQDTSNFVVKDQDGTNTRYVIALCESCLPLVGVRAFRDAFEIKLRVHDDVRWRSTSLTQPATWSITATAQQTTITNPGTDDAYPEITIMPTSAKSGTSDYTYKAFQIVRWRASTGASLYPVDIVNNGLDTATLVSGGKMQSDGDDLRVKVDGSEVDRWLQDMNNATTQVWVNLDFEPAWSSTITAAIDSGDSPTSITFDDDTSALPSEGLIEIGGEVFTYTSKNDSTKTITLGARAAKGSSAASHSLGATAYWLQHEIYLLYGNPSATAPTVDDDYKPAFELDSTNTSWDYDVFGSDDGKRTAPWVYAEEMSVNSYGSALHKYTGDRDGGDTDPWQYMGIHFYQWGQRAYWKATNPCGITAANFVDGEAWAEDLTHFYVWLYSGSPETQEDVVASPGEGFPTSASTWEAWSDNETLTSGMTSVWLYATPAGGYQPEGLVQVGDVTLTLNSTYTPTVQAIAEETSYALTCTITNTETGDAFSIDYSGVQANESITVDTDERTVTDDQDGSSQFQALTLVGGARKHWLRLVPGDNVIQYDDEATAGVDVDFSFRARFY